MATEHNEQRIRCPFFEAHDQHEISCSGIYGSTKVGLYFTYKTDMLLHLNVFCCGRPHYCELYEGIRSAHAHQPTQENAALPT